MYKKAEEGMISERREANLNCARCTKGTNQRLSYEGIFVYHWFVRSRENLIARAKPYLEDKGRRWRHSVDCARVSEFSGYSLQKSPYIAAPYCFL